MQSVYYGYTSNRTCKQFINALALSIKQKTQKNKVNSLNAIAVNFLVVVFFTLPVIILQIQIFAIAARINLLLP